MDEFVLIEAPSNLGLAPPSPGVEPGVKYFPESMKNAGFTLSFAKTTSTIDVPAYTTTIDGESKVRNAGSIIEFSKQLASRVAATRRQKNKPIVLGGDCSVLIGAALALKREGDYGLFFLDGHTDYVSPEQSGSAGAAGMDLAIVAGMGHEKLADIDHKRPYFDEGNIFCCGNRDTSEDWYVKEIENSRIHYFDLARLRQLGMNVVARQFIDHTRLKNLDGFWVHYDVDVLNDEIMPCVDSRQPGGLSYEELEQLLRPLVYANSFCGMDITIFDPTLDREEFYANQLASELNKLFLR